jgi:ankyrin repeat protein
MTAAQELYEAIKAGDEGRVAAVLDSDPETIHGGGAAGMAPLMLAIYRQKPEIVSLLLARSAEVDIFAAAALGRTEVCRWKAMSDQVALNMNSPDGWTPLHLASFFGQLETAEMLLELGADVKARGANSMHNTPLHAAAAGRHAGICALLLKQGAEVNATQSGGYTALHSAAANGDMETVRLLLAHEADPAVRAENGQTALEMARQKNQQNVVELLEKT